MKNAPSYSIASVDSALQLAAALQVEGTLSVSEAADRLGVARSTAHRLLSMLVYRDFAEQLPDRRYGPGPVLRGGALPQAPVARVREAALPHLRRVVDALGETANVMVLAGSDVRFIGTVECAHILRVGDRSGRTLPVHLSSGGKAVLATLDREQLAPHLEALEADTAARLERELRTVRRRGFAVNDQETETGLTAVGVAVPDPQGTVRAALSLAVPTARYSRERLPEWGAVLLAAAAGVSRDLGLT
jgi:DNA-binding IclR family transcriptional regulator